MIVLDFINFMDNCTIDCIDIIGNFSTSAACDFVTSSCNQDTIQFVQGYYCDLHQSFSLLIFIAIIVMVMVYYALQILTDHYLTPCVEEFIEKLNMSQTLAGVTFLAFANGAPDIITAIVAGSSTSSSTALIPFGSVNGAALFDMAFVLSMVIQFSPTKQLVLKKRQALIPLAFYVFGTAYLIVVSLIFQRMNIIIALLFLLLYPIYIGTVLYQERKFRQKQKKSLLEDEAHQKEQEETEGEAKRVHLQDIQKQIQQAEQINKQKKQSLLTNSVKAINHLYKFVFNYAVPPTTKNEWSPLRAIISLVLAPVVNCFAFGLSDSFQKELLNIPYAVWFTFPPVILIIHSIFCLFKKEKPQKTSIIYSIYSFTVIICWIAEVCSILINLFELLQLLTNINSVFLGLTVLAWANSIGDYLSITAFAKKGYASTAIAGIFSGPLMNFLLGFGISLTINSLSGQYDFVIFDFTGKDFEKISDSIVVVVIALTIIYMIWISIRIVKTNGVLKIFQQKFGFFYYIACIAITLFISVLTDFYRTISCDL